MEKITICHKIEKRKIYCCMVCYNYQNVAQTERKWRYREKERKIARESVRE